MKRLSLLLILAAPHLVAEVTYSKEISRLMEAKCQNCHRTGDIAPFPLTTYDETKSRLSAIRGQVSQGLMPPWKPSHESLAFRGSFGLTADERRLLLDWIAEGAPEGDRADLSAPSLSASEWQLGDPDLVVEMSKPFDVPPGGDTYRCFVLPYEFSQSRWLSAVQVLPGNRSVAHHALLFLDPDGVSEAWDGKDGKPGYDCFGTPGEGVEDVVGAWVPGARISRLPEAIGIPLPGRGRIVLQVHYHAHADQSHHAAHGGAQDRSKVGLYFTKTPPKQEMVYGSIESDEIEIAAGAKNHSVEVELSLSPVIPLEMFSVGPHMHLLGKSIKVEKLSAKPDEKAQTIIAINDWDFDYQGFYTFEEKLSLEPGSRLRLTCNYDNSADNPRNPNQPPQRVTYGEKTTDEMCLTFIGIVLPEGFFTGQNQSRAAATLWRKR